MISGHTNRCKDKWGGSTQNRTRQLASNPYIVPVITDIHMPGMDGFGLVSAIRRNSAYNRVAVIANTQFANNELEERILNAGADDFIYKPTAPSVILSRVKNVLQKYC